jgi:hypothetical protein
MANDLNLPAIADDQADQQWQTSNDADAALANALSDTYTVDFSAGNVTLTSAQYRSAMVFKPTGLTANRDLTLPAVKRPLTFHNSDASWTVTLKCGSASIAVAPGEIFTGYTDGTANGLYGAGLATGAATSHPYDLALAFAGTPTASELIGKLIVPRAVELAANFGGSYGHIGTNPTATFAVDVKDDGSTIGTISVSTGGAFTFTTSGGTAKTVAAGSRIEFFGPGTADATAADIAATLAGTAT